MHTPLCLLGVCLLFAFSGAARIPVILDTDIGRDIDDTWALSFLLQHPDVDLKLVLTDSHNTPARAQVVAKFLTTVQRTDVPIGIGWHQDNSSGPMNGALFPWASDFNLSKYNGTLYQDGITAMIDIITNSTQPIVLVVISPCPNIQMALQRNPSIVKNTIVITRSGSLKVDIFGSPPVVAEYNIRDNIMAAQALYAASWNITEIPLDVTALTQIGGNVYQSLLHSQNPITTLMLLNFQYWFQNCGFAQNSTALPPNPSYRSSTLHDLVAATSVVHTQYLNWSNMGIMVNSTGFSVVNSTASPIQVATAWDKGGFQEWENLIQKTLGPQKIM
eukprot:TRINITY_DN2329_c0_g1_i1.p1 TRINITY_DN2329_c0_g1~~TRINITY_DN2329_c0_g1_i1.p1  ORF type:complete len:332 (-),score=59.90 TRINITY_DN2329_c0_g1_i1:41-1036(-)